MPIDRCVVIDDDELIRWGLEMNARRIFGLERDQLIVFSFAPDFHELQNAFKGAALAVLVCDRDLGMGDEGEEITRVAKEELGIPHVALHTASNISREILEKLESLQIRYFRKGDGELFEWMKSLS